MKRCGRSRLVEASVALCRRFGDWRERRLDQRRRTRARCGERAALVRGCEEEREVLWRIDGGTLRRLAAPAVVAVRQCEHGLGEIAGALAIRAQAALSSHLTACWRRGLRQTSR